MRASLETGTNIKYGSNFQHCRREMISGELAIFTMKFMQSKNNKHLTVYIKFFHNVNNKHKHVG